MADTKLRDPEDSPDGRKTGGLTIDNEGHISDNGSTVDAQTYAYTEDRKIGVTGAVFLILNKMIGTGSECFPRCSTLDHGQLTS